MTKKGRSPFIARVWFSVAPGRKGRRYKSFRLTVPSRVGIYNKSGEAGYVGLTTTTETQI